MEKGHLLCCTPQLSDVRPMLKFTFPGTLGNSHLLPNPYHRAIILGDFIVLRKGPFTITTKVHIFPNYILVFKAQNPFSIPTLLLSLKHTCNS